MKISAEVLGGKELENALRQLPKATSKNVLRRSLKKAAQPTEDLARALSPTPHTGNLQQSIQITTKLVKSQKDETPQGAVKVFISATSPKGSHAHLIEFGTVKMAARPFLRPAWDATKAQFMATFSKEVWEALAKSARTLARKAERGTLSKTALR